jgi:hypothetical protein
VTTVAKGSLKRHRNTKACLAAKKLQGELVALARAAPPPLTANEAREHARAMRAGM